MFTFSLSHQTNSSEPTGSVYPSYPYPPHKLASKHGHGASLPPDSTNPHKTGPGFSDDPNILEIQTFFHCSCPCLLSRPSAPSRHSALLPPKTPCFGKLRRLLERCHNLPIEASSIIPSRSPTVSPITSTSTETLAVLY